MGGTGEGQQEQDSKDTAPKIFWFWFRRRRFWASRGFRIREGLCHRINCVGRCGNVFNAGLEQSKAIVPIAQRTTGDNRAALRATALQQPLKTVGFAFFELVQFVEKPFQLILGRFESYKRRLDFFETHDKRVQADQQMMFVG